MGGYARLPSETKATLQEIARLSYGSSAFEGRKGGSGRMGALVDGGRVRVFKFNTHSSERAWKFGRNKATEGMKQNSDNLRGILLAIARTSGCGADEMREIRSKLGLRDRQDANRTLLDRKVVAQVVEMIGGDEVWEDAWRGRRKADYASQADMSYARLAAPGIQLGHKGLGEYQGQLRAYTADAFKALVDSVAAEYAGKLTPQDAKQRFLKAYPRVFDNNRCEEIAKSLCAVSESGLRKRITQCFDRICRLALPAEGDKPVVTAALGDDCCALIAAGADSLLKERYDFGNDLTVAELESWGMTFEDLEAVEPEYPVIRDLLAIPEGRKLLKAALKSSPAASPAEKRAEAVRICRDLASLAGQAVANGAARMENRFALIAEFAERWYNGSASLPAGMRLCDVIHRRAEDREALVRAHASGRVDESVRRIVLDMVCRLPLDCPVKRRAFLRASESLGRRFAKIEDLVGIIASRKKTGAERQEATVTLVKKLLIQGDWISSLSDLFDPGTASAARRQFATALLDSFMRANPKVRTMIDLMMRSNTWRTLVDSQAGKPGHGALVAWGRERERKVSGSSLLKTFDDGSENPQFGPIEGMFKDGESRDIALQIMGLLDVGHPSLLGRCLFLSMLPGAVGNLRTNGFPRPLTRERLCEAFSVKVRHGAALDVGTFTDKFVDGLDERAQKDVGLNNFGAVTRLCVQGMRYESALALLRNRNRAVGRDDFFLFPRIFGRFEFEGEEDAGKFLQKGKADFLGDGLRTANVVFSFGGKKMLQQDSKTRTLVPANLDRGNAKAKERFVDGVVGKIRARMPGMTDLQLARVLFTVNQSLCQTLQVLDPICEGNENFTVECTAGARGAVHVKVAPRSEGSGGTVVGRFLVEFDVGRNGQIRLTRLQSRGKDWEL